MNLILPIYSIMLLSLLIIVYFSKKRFLNSENKVFKIMLIANIFGITLNDLASVSERPKTNVNKHNKVVILLLSIGLTWFIAVIAFALLMILSLDMVWMPYIYAIPVTAIVSIVFSKIWKYRKLLFLSLTLLYYSVPLAICMQMKWEYNMYVLFFVAIPLHILTILWFFRKKR